MNSFNAIEGLSKLIAAHPDLFTLSLFVRHTLPLWHLVKIHRKTGSGGRACRYFIHASTFLIELEAELLFETFIRLSAIFKEIRWVHFSSIQVVINAE